MANGVASMIAFFQLLIANKGARRTRAEVASVRLLTRMMAVGEIAARLDAARRSGGSRFVAARKCDDGEAAMALQIFGHWRISLIDNFLDSFVTESRENSIENNPHMNSIPEHG